MKAAPFEYLRADSLEQAVERLAEDDGGGRVLGGGQSLGAMLNLRVVQPSRLVDLDRLPALREVHRTDTGLRLGARVTHAEIEDRVVPDVTAGLMPSVAGGIAYRAVRNRGTLGGSLVHADPAADWVSVMRLLDARLHLFSRRGARMLAMRDFMLGPFTTALEPDEVLVAVEVPALAPQARWSYRKSCRKPGEFAQAIAAVWVDEAAGVTRAVIGATDTVPWLADGPRAVAALAASDGRRRALDEAGVEDEDARDLHEAILVRALHDAGLPVREA